MPSAAPVPTRYRWRAVAVWAMIAIVEVLHGTLRTLLLQPTVGDLASRQIGVFTGSLLILGIALLFTPWLGAAGRRQLYLVGAIWLALMLAFEVLLGRAFGMSWSRIVADYDPTQGGFMLFGMLVLFFAPSIASRVTRRQQHRPGKALWRQRPLQK